MSTSGLPTGTVDGAPDREPPEPAPTPGQGRPDEPDDAQTSDRPGRARQPIGESGSSSRHSSVPSRARAAELQHEVDALEAELARRDEQLQFVIDRYESILAEKEREHRQRIRELDSRGRVRDRLAARVRRWLRSIR